MEVTDETIENACEDLKNALSDLLENGKNEEGYDRSCDMADNISSIIDRLIAQ